MNLYIWPHLLFPATNSGSESCLILDKNPLGKSLYIPDSPLLLLYLHVVIESLDLVFFHHNKHNRAISSIMLALAFQVWNLLKIPYNTYT